jgi:hexokinase
VVNFNDNGDYNLVSYKRTTLPGINKEYTKEDFFNYIYDFIDEEIKDNTKIGFCFSYPMEKYPNKDGKLIQWTKEVQAPEVVGEFIGKNLLDILEKHDVAKRNIVLLNDTVASLFGGIANANIRDYDNFIGLIVGTGCNTAYLEKQVNIPKLNLDNVNPDEEQVINIESGNFDKLYITGLDRIINDMSKEPYKQVLEKMVSGRYMMKLIYHLTMMLIDNSIAPEMDSVCELLKGIELKDLSEWVYYGDNCSNAFYGKLKALDPSNNQIKVLSIVIQTIINRAASIVAVKLSAIIHKRGKGIQIHKPTAIVAEGAVIETLPYFKDYLKYHLVNLLKELGDYYFDIIHINRANIIGSAVAASVNC